MTRELIVDSFAGGGGASTGIEMALRRSPDIAINHDRVALAMHRMNHPGAHHAEEDVVSIDSVGLCAGRPVGLFWLSPDCKHHSKAKGGKPRDKNIRGLAWTGFSFVKSLPAWQRPRVVILENVEEFAREAKRAALVVACWGCGAWDEFFVEHVLEEITSGSEPWPDVYALRLSPIGHPMHPMARGRNRLPDDIEPVLWRKGSS